MTFGGPLWKRQAPTHVVEGATAVWAVPQQPLAEHRSCVRWSG